MDAYLHHLRWFLVVAEELHLVRAAQKLYVTQSALSKMLARLEGQVGTPLVARSHRSLALTPAGAAFRDGVDRAVGEIDDAAAAARSVAPSVTQRLRLGFNVPIDDVLTRLVRRVRQTSPEIEVQLFSFVNTDISAGLRYHVTDAAFTSAHLDIADLAFVPLFEDVRVVVLPADHPRADAEVLSIDDVLALDATDTWLVPPGPPAGSRSSRRFWSLAEERNGGMPRTWRTISSNEDMVQCIAVGLGVGVGMRCIIERYALPGVVTVPIDGLSSESIGLAWRASRRTAALDAVAAAAHSLGGPTTRGSEERLRLVPKGPE